MEYQAGMQSLREQFDRDGMVLIPDVLSAGATAQALAECEQMLATAKPVQNPAEREFFGVRSLRCEPPLRAGPIANALRELPAFAAVVDTLFGGDAHYTGTLLQIYLGASGHQQSWHSDSDPDDAPLHFVTLLVYLQDQTPVLG
jgi:hypothetical protein